MVGWSGRGVGRFPKLSSLCVDSSAYLLFKVSRKESAMSITEATLTAVLNLHDVPIELHRDPELRAVAYVLAALQGPSNDVERRFYDA